MMEGERYKRVTEIKRSRKLGWDRSLNPQAPLCGVAAVLLLWALLLEVAAWHVVIRPELACLSGPAAHTHTNIHSKKKKRGGQTDGGSDTETKAETRRKGVTTKRKLRRYKTGKMTEPDTGRQI